MTFKNEHLSVSRLKLYEACPRAFFHRYVEKTAWKTAAETVLAQDVVAPITVDNEPAQFGTVLHAALEMTFTWVVAEEYAGEFPLDRLLVAYKAAFAEAALTGAGLYTEGLNILRRYAFDQGPVDHVDILAVEQEFNIVVDGHKLNGFIDRVDRIDDEAIQIIDYKSNRRLFTGDELRGDLQMSIYGLAARELYPWAKRVLFAFHMLRFGGLVQTALRTARAIDDAAGYVAALGERSERDVEWTPVLNENCAFCDHRRRCPLYERAIDGKLPIVRVANTDDLDAVSREREHVANVAKAAYARKSELDEAIKAALSLRDELRAGGRVYRFQHPSETAYDVDRVVRAFTAAGVDRDEIERRVLAVDARAVEELRVEVVTNFANGRSPLLLKADLEAAAKKVPMSPRLDSRADKTVATKATDGAKKEKAK